MTHVIKTRLGDVLLDEDDATRLRVSERRLSFSQKGYPTLSGKKLHQMILGKVHGFVTDHINNNKLDNRRCNLRHVTVQQNSWNKAPNKKYKSSIYKGVHVEERNADGTPKRWRAEIVFNGKRYRRRNLKSEVEAARWYDSKARDFFGEYAWLNFKNV